MHDEAHLQPSDHPPGDGTTVGHRRLLDGACVLPPQVAFFGQALVPVAGNARRAMARRVRPSGHEFVTLEDLTRHMALIHQALVHLSSRLESLMTDVIGQPQAGLAEAGRVAGRLEQVLSEFVDGYLDAKATHAEPEASEARTLLLGLYRHRIREICDWLDELVAVIANPAAALLQRGVDPVAGVTLTVTLKMGRPAEMAKLDALARRLLPPRETCIEPSPAVEPQEPRTPGLVGTLGPLAFGFGVTKALLRRNHG